MFGFVIGAVVGGLIGYFGASAQSRLDDTPESGPTLPVLIGLTLAGVVVGGVVGLFLVG